MFFLLRYTGDLNKYINMKYAYLSMCAIVMLAFLSLFQFILVYREEKKAEREWQLAQDKLERESGDNSHTQGHGHDHHKYDHHEHDHHDHAHAHNHHGHAFQEDVHGHSHAPSSRLKRVFTYSILAVPILTGIFCPVATLDSSFVKAKGFSFPSLEQSQKDPGFHQFLRPDTSVFYGTEGYNKVKNKELSEFSSLNTVNLTDDNYLKGMEVIYNFSTVFTGKTIDFDGFAYKGEQVDDEHYFIFRFGFIHCVADSGVFGMLVDMPKGVQLKNDDWIHVSGKLTWELYQPFKQTIPVLKVTEWKRIDPPKDPYVYRTF